MLLATSRTLFNPNLVKVVWSLDVTKTVRRRIGWGHGPEAFMDPKSDGFSVPTLRTRPAISVLAKNIPQRQALGGLFLSRIINMQCPMQQEIAFAQRWAKVD